MFVMNETHVWAIQQGRRIIRTCAARCKDPNMSQRMYKIQGLMEHVEDNVRILSNSPDVNSEMSRNNELEHPV
jgi:hypothetical protein